MTKLWKVSGKPTEKQLDEIASMLRAGGVVLLPTDTIYGLHAVVTNVRAVDQIVIIKGRAETKSFVVLASSIAQLPGMGVIMNEELSSILASIWPAPLTAIVPLRQPIAASRGAMTIAVRIPDLDWLRSLVNETGPLVSTSANRSGEPPVPSPLELSEEVRTALDGIVDAGPHAGEPSVIVDFTESEPRLVREGEGRFTQKVWKTLRKSL